MGLQNINGTVTLPKNGYKGHVYVWEKFDLANGKEVSRKWVVWTTAFPTDITEGTWVEVQGEFGISVARDMDGKPMTYTDKNGDEITKHDLSLNNVNIIQVKEKNNPIPEGVDMDDVRKYGTAQNRGIIDDNPF
jgi:hypothetical protein